MAAHEGGCVCGAVRYRLNSDLSLAGWCHCTTCEKVSGSPGMVFASIPRGDLVYVQGEDRLKPLTLTSFAERAFCGDCGSPLTIAYDFQPEMIDFAVCTLDDPGVAPPQNHIFYASRPPWLDVQDGLPKFDRFRPGTQGLEGTEPPEVS